MNEYNDCGAEGSTACELEEADDSGRLRLSVFFRLDKKCGRCFSFSLSKKEAAVAVAGTSVEVDALTVEYNDDALDIGGSSKLVVDAVAKLGRNTPLFGEGSGGGFMSVFLEMPILFGFENSFIFDDFSLITGRLSGNAGVCIVGGEVLPDVDIGFGDGIGLLG